MEANTCFNCIHLKNSVCKKLEDVIYPEYYCHDNSGFYIDGFDIDMPKVWGCSLFKPVESYMPCKGCKYADEYNKPAFEHCQFCERVAIDRFEPANGD